MKKQFTILVLLLINTLLIAQEGTTLEEYRYLSKGYIYQLEMGLDAQKEGYLIKQIFKAPNETKLVGLYKSGQQEPRALLVILDPGSASTTYICVPNGKAEERVKELAAAEQTQLKAQQLLQYQTALNEFLFAALSSPDTHVPALHQQAQIPINYGSNESFATRSATQPKTQTTVKSPQNIVVPTTSTFEYKPITKEEPTLGSNVESSAKTPISTATSTSTSTVAGELSTRAILQKQEAIHNSKNRGIVSIKICVDRDGNVKSAKFTQRGSTTFNSSLKKAALDAAKKTKFAKLDLAEQCGIIKYDFL